MLNPTFIYLSEIELRNVIRTEITQIIRSELQHIYSKAPPDINESYLDIKGASSFLKLSVHTLRKKAQNREIPCIKRNGKWIFKHSELQSYLENGKRKSIDEIREQASIIINDKLKDDR